MADLKKLSVIIPAYNAEKFLVKCVESVINQTYKNIEIIIVDDGSSDSTPQICDELANKYDNIKIIHQENQGSNIARLNGFNTSCGEYISFVDSDDYIDLNAYAKAIKVLEENDCDMVQFGIYTVDLDGNIIKEWHRDNMTFNNSRDVYLYFLTNKSPTWNVWDKVYKRSLFDNIEWPHISMMEDYCISAQLFARTQKLMTIDEYFYYYVQNPASLCHDSPNTNPKIRKDIAIACDLVVKLTEKNFPEMLPDALAREMGGLSSFLLDFWPQVYQVIRKDYINMRNEFKARGIKIKASTAENQKLLLHAHYLATHPKLYKLYLTTRLAVKKYTGI